MRKYFIGLSFVVLCICLVFLGGKRDFFQEMPAMIRFGDGYFMTISKYPSFSHFPFRTYSYDWNLPGTTRCGYLKNMDSLICFVGWNGGRNKYNFFDFRRCKNNREYQLSSIPSFDFYRKDTNGDYYFKFTPLSFSRLPQVDYILYRVSFNEGVKGFLIVYRNKKTQAYGTFKY